MKIVHAYPPNYTELSKEFNLKGRKVVFTFGDTLYAPGDEPIAGHLLAHEETHSRQQAELGIDEWWSKYLSDTDFRLSQELEAYRQQYAFIAANYNRAARRKALDHLSADLSGPIYGKILSKSEAKELIQTI